MGVATRLMVMAVYLSPNSALAHRISYATFKGPVLEDDCVLHKCNVTSCINPDHLYLGDRADNMRDTVAADHHLYGDRHVGSRFRW